jgi:hypothetical protein
MNKIVILILVFLFIPCTNNSQKGGRYNASPTQDATQPADKCGNSEKVCFFCTLLQGINKKGEEIKPDLTKEPIKTVINFLKWYRENEKTLSKIQMVNIPSIEEKNSFYTVNFEKTEQYLAALKKSGFVSDKYMDQWRDYFKKADIKLKQNPMNDGPPDGFEFDFVLWTQEIDETLEAINNPKLISTQITTDNAIVTLDILMRLEYKLSKQGDKWLIDDIQVLVK